MPRFPATSARLAGDNQQNQAQGGGIQGISRANPSGDSKSCEPPEWGRRPLGCFLQLQGEAGRTPSSAACGAQSPQLWLGERGHPSRGAEGISPTGAGGSCSCTT